ncbi:MAG: UDP-N-acetylglucosamine diphosphorylase [Puniceicoccales bacterium]|jgi:NDP-sugar pyrophosphorylase family protein|nr:UDP-N-acetylglucosamine diphosphorylase [Puniceicoccales bacterium]
MSFPASTLFDWPRSLENFAEYFPLDEEPWLWLPKIERALEGIVPTLRDGQRDFPPGLQVGQNVYIHSSVKLPHLGTLEDNIYIGEGVHLNPGIYIRRNVIIAANCVVGTACELKNSILMEGTKVPHFNYVGDSVLGNRVQLGAMVVTANLRLDHRDVLIKTPAKSYATHRRKVGAFVGDEVRVACNTALQPGTVLGRRCTLLPRFVFSGFLEAEHTGLPKDRNVGVMPGGTEA